MRTILNLTDIRRVVTAENNDGASFVSFDGPVVRQRELSAFFWASNPSKSSVPIRAKEDPLAGELSSLIPSPGETRFAAWMVPAHTQPTADSPLVPRRLAGKKTGAVWHATRSYDYQIVIQGKIWLELDSEEVLLRSGDVVVLGGVNHAWNNRSDEPCLLYAVSVGVPEKQ